MPHGSACPPGRDLNRKDCHRLHRIVPSWKKGNDSSGGEDSGKYKDWLPKCILVNRAHKRFEVFYNINGKRKKHFRTATVILPISSGEDLEQHQAICRRSPSGESSFSYEIYLLIMSYISPPVTPVVKKKTHYGVSSFHIVKSSIRLQENMIFSGIKDPELDDDDDYGQAGHSEPSLGSSLFHPTLLKQAFLGQH